MKVRVQAEHAHTSAMVELEKIFLVGGFEIDIAGYEGYRIIRHVKPGGYNYAYTEYLHADGNWKDYADQCCVYLDLLEALTLLTENRIFTFQVEIENQAAFY